jgi:methionyl-tRNA formyltransferase
VIDDLDCVVTIGYGVLLPEHILVLPKYGFINLHFSLLPAYRGAAPAQRALENGETVTGVTVFYSKKEWIQVRSIRSIRLQSILRGEVWNF